MNSLIPAGDEMFEGILSTHAMQSEWTHELQEFLASHPNIMLPDNPSNKLRHQAICLLALHKGIGFNRSQLTAIFDKLGIRTNDSIQAVNKLPQLGLNINKAGTARSPYYGFAELAYNDRYIRTRVDSTTRQERNISETDSRRFFSELSREPYEAGHKDPRLPLSGSNLIMQPVSINRPFRDN